MDVQDITHFLRLQALPRIGIKTLSTLCSTFDTALYDFHKIPNPTLSINGWSSEQLKILRGNCKTTETSIARALHWQSVKTKRSIIHYSCPDYPDSLRELASPPLVIFCEGRLDLLRSPKLAIVGTRAPTQYAYDALNTLLPPLRNTGIVTISGLALGVDAICHRTSLANEIPTIAVLGNGIDVIYPKRHQKLQSQIQESGLLLSEFHPHIQPKPHQFPRRNRLISGLSEGLLVTEARIKSGTMVSVKFAIEQNKEVLAVPGNINNKNSELSHYLIKDGATPVVESNDIIDAVPKFSQYKIFVPTNENNCNMDLASDPLLDSVNYSATSVDLIAQRTGTSVVDVLTQLLEYELRGLVASTPEGYIRLRG